MSSLAFQVFYEFNIFGNWLEEMILPPVAARSYNQRLEPGLVQPYNTSWSVLQNVIDVTWDSTVLDTSRLVCSRLPQQIAS